MTSLTDRRLLHLAARQGGVVAFAQAMESGLSQAAVARRIHDREWVRVQPRAYRLAALPADRAGPLWAAALSAPEAVAGGRSAAWWHGLVEAPPAVPEVLLPRSCHRLLVGVRSVRTALDPMDLTVRRGLRVVRPAMAVVQSIAARPTDGVELLDRALQEGLGHPALQAAAHRWRRRPGIGRVTHLLEAAADGAASEAERIAHGLLRSAGIGGWLANHRVGRFVVDIAFVDARLAIEIDGWASHHTHERFQRDRARQNALVLAGWTVIRFTWADLTQDPARVVAEVARALEQ